MEYYQWVDPQYAQVTKEEAARICGKSQSSFDELRRTDPECPKGFKERDTRQCPVMFRLSDVYAYSAILMDRAKKVG